MNQLMKKYKFLIGLAILAGFSLSSCDDFLEENPENKKTSASFWETANDAQTAVDGLYFGGVPYLHNTNFGTGWSPKQTMVGGLTSGLFVDKRKDRTITNAIEACAFNTQNFDDVAYNIWHECYKGISRANFVIANVPNMTSVLDEATIKRYLGEAKFFRAYNYAELVVNFGDVPYVDKPYTNTDGMFIERIASTTVYDNIENELLEVINGNYLPDKAFYDNGSRVTKGMVQTLLAQVYLQRAGFPINGGKEYYEKAAKMAEQVITSGQHVLEQASGSSDDLNSAFNVIKTSKTTKEVIYAKEYNYTSFNSGSSYYNLSMPNSAAQWADANGNTIFNPSGDVLYTPYLPCDMLLKSYAPEDIRGHEKQFFFNEYTDATGVKHVLDQTGTWYWFDEVPLMEGHSSDLNINNWRYSEVLLIAAEGYARAGVEGTARGYLNQVRKRAGLADETASGDALIQSILTERIHEFPVEFKIWDDIRRTRLYPQPAGDYSGKLNWVALANATIYNKPDGQVKTGAIPEFALLWSIPLDEMQRNPALANSQNPGWK